MKRIEIYDSAFREIFMIDPDMELTDKNILNVEAWHSLEHFAFVAELEERFAIKLSDEDIIKLTSYEAGLEILRQYGIEI